MDGIRPTPLPPFPPSTLPVCGDLSERAQSVARGPRWAWWDEVNPDDQEPCAQPWANLGLVDLIATGRHRESNYLGRHYCSRCVVTFCDVVLGEVDPCWCCGEMPDDAWGENAARADTQPGHDALQRHLRTVPRLSRVDSTATATADPADAEAVAES